MAALYHVICGDELRPACASGYRIVIARVGRRWVHLKQAFPIATIQHRQFKKISRNVWDSLTAYKVEDPATKLGDRITKIVEGI